MSRQEHYTLQSSLINRGSYLSAHCFQNISNELGEKEKKCEACRVNTRAQMLDDIKIYVPSTIFEF